MNKKQSATNKPSNKRTNKKIMAENFNEKIKTYITHNKGSSWELIKAPAEDMKGKSTSCFVEDGCSLHLQMYTNNDFQLAPPYSQESAIGIVMSVGNLG